MEYRTLTDLVNEAGIDTIGFSVVVLLVMSIIQIAPIEINPWSFIANLIGKALNKDVIKRIDEIENVSKLSHEEVLKNYQETKNEIQSIRRELHETRAISCRVRILKFEDEIQHNIRHSKESFDQVMSDITYYENFCENNPMFLNNMIDIVIKHIKDVYKRQLQTHDFD